METCTIYLLKNTVNSKVYVGQTWQTFENRWNCGYECCTYLKNAMNKHGEDKFYYETLAMTSDQDLANYLEEICIEEYKSTNPEYGYNILSGGNNSRRPKELKEKVSIACRGINAKINASTALRIFNDQRIQKEIAIAYNVNTATVSDIKNGRSWSWVTGKEWNKSILEDNIVLDIFNALGSHNSIAKRYNSTRQTVGNIKNGITWSHITGKIKGEN